VGADQVQDDRAARVGHAAGRSYPDLVRLRAGDGAGARRDLERYLALYPRGRFSGEVTTALAALPKH